MEAFKVDDLPWDSQFFGFKIAKCSGDESSSEGLCSLVEKLKRAQYRLAYLFSSKPISSEVFKNSGAQDFFLADTKICFYKTLQGQPRTEESVKSVLKMNPTKQLIGLAIQSGEFSRFNIDKNIEREKFEALYQTWIENSLDGSIAKDVLAISMDDKLAGVITIGEKNARADIGLLAVDFLYRGCKLGKKLVRAAEAWAFNAGYDSIQVYTQGENIKACRFYEKSGFTKETTEFVYHIWL